MTPLDRARSLDAADPLAWARERFVTEGDVVAYLDGNSLGRPLRTTAGALTELVAGPWASRLIRAWDEGWMHAPTELGDLLARVTLGAAPGQTVVADSTTVLLYKLVRAAVAARPGRTEVVADTENFPTDRFVLEGVAAECGLTIRWVEPDAAAGVTLDDVRARLSERTALVLLSHVAYKSAFVADLPRITAAAHEAGALVLWDLCHSVGALDLRLDDAGVDLAVGCTYKYLNGGPGAPAFAYVNAAVQHEIRQPIQGWMGAADPFAMGPAYTGAASVRQLVSGTPPIVAMAPMREMLTLIDDVGMAAIREKSVALTAFAVELYDELLAPHGVELLSPRDPDSRGGHVSVGHPSFGTLVRRLWERGVIPDFRPPRGLRLGLSPLSTSFEEVAIGVAAIADGLRAV